MYHTALIFLVCLLTRHGVVGQAELNTDDIVARLSACARDLLAVVNGEYPNYFQIINSCGKQVNHLGNFDECRAMNNTR